MKAQKRKDIVVGLPSICHVLLFLFFSASKRETAEAAELGTVHIII